MSANLVLLRRCKSSSSCPITEDTDLLHGRSNILGKARHFDVSPGTVISVGSGETELKGFRVLPDGRSCRTVTASSRRRARSQRWCGVPSVVQYFRTDQHRQWTPCISFVKECYQNHVLFLTHLSLTSSYHKTHHVAYDSDHCVEVLCPLNTLLPWCVLRICM